MEGEREREGVKKKGRKKRLICRTSARNDLDEEGLGRGDRVGWGWGGAPKATFIHTHGEMADGAL